MIVANSTMRDLFFGLDVAPIGEMPYKSVTELAMLDGRGRLDLALASRPRARAASCTRTGASSGRR